MGFLKKISQFGPTVWQAIANNMYTQKYIHVYIYERRALLYIFSLIF